MAHNVFSPAYSVGVKFANNVIAEVKDKLDELSAQEAENFLAGLKAGIDIGTISLTDEINVRIR